MHDELRDELSTLVREAQRLIPGDGLLTDRDEWHSRAEMAMQRLKLLDQQRPTVNMLRQVIATLPNSTPVQIASDVPLRLSSVLVDRVEGVQVVKLVVQR